QRRAIESTKKHPRFAYLSPLLKQSKTVAWDYLRDAMSLLRKAGATVNETELRADYPNGGQVRLYGADNPDALRGFYLDGVVLDEYADMDPRVWPEIIRPCLSDREGWAVFIGTPRGRNSLFKIWQQSRTQPGWFSLMLKASESGLLPQDELAMARADLPEDKYAQASDRGRHRCRSHIPSEMLVRCRQMRARHRGLEALSLGPGRQAPGAQAQPRARLDLPRGRRVPIPGDDIGQHGIGPQLLARPGVPKPRHRLTHRIYRFHETDRIGRMERGCRPTVVEVRKSATADLRCAVSKASSSYVPCQASSAPQPDLSTNSVRGISVRMIVQRWERALRRRLTTSYSRVHACPFFVWGCPGLLSCLAHAPP